MFGITAENGQQLNVLPEKAALERWVPANLRVVLWQQELAVLDQKLFDVNPAILHLTGHNSTPSSEGNLHMASRGLLHKEGGAAGLAATISRRCIKGDDVSHRPDGHLQCVVINACESEELGISLRTSGVPTVVCWPGLTDDSCCADFTENFYRSLSNEPRQYQRCFNAATDLLPYRKLLVPNFSRGGELTVAVQNESMPAPKLLTEELHMAPPQLLPEDSEAHCRLESFCIKFSGVLPQGSNL